MKSLYTSILLFLITLPSFANSLDSLTSTLVEAYEEADFEKYKSCFYDKGVTAEDWDAHLGRFKYKTAPRDNQKLECEVEVFSEVTNSTYAAYGKKYYPNHEPDGRLRVLFNNGSTISFIYANVDGKHFVIPNISEDLKWEGERDKWISFSTNPILNWGEVGKPETYKIKIYYNASGVDLERTSFGVMGIVGQYFSKIELVEPLEEDVEVTLNVMEKSIDDQKVVATFKASKGTKILYKKQVEQE